MQFCPKCKAIMIPKLMGKKPVLSCGACGYTDKKSEAEPVVEKLKPVKEIKVVTENEKDVLPTAKAKCPNCGHDTAYFWLQQTRAGDEPETRFLKCVKCKNTWREYS